MKKDETRWAIGETKRHRVRKKAAFDWRLLSHGNDPRPTYDRPLPCSTAEGRFIT